MTVLGPRERGGEFGWTVSGAGDFNGDGRQDLIAGAPLNSFGYASLMLGRLGPSTTIDSGPELFGPWLGSWLGASVARLGDINGDGLGDVLVGAPLHTFPDGSYPGSADIVFGSTSPSDISVGAYEAYPTRPYKYVIGGVDGGAFGSAVANVGDQNGDGVSDMAISAAQLGANERSHSGVVYVVYSRPYSRDNVYMSSTIGYYEIQGAAAGDYAGDELANAGDVNGDGRTDLLIGVPSHNHERGAAYVVFGKSDTLTVDLAHLGSGGYRIDGAGTGDWAGVGVDNAGDVNGDGRADQIVGAPGVGEGNDGAAYIVRGKSSSTTVDLGHLGGGGYKLGGAGFDEGVGSSVAGAGDISGDGRPDQLIGAPGAEYNNRPGSGSTYYVPGRAGTGLVRLDDLEDGYRIDGARDLVSSGFSVAGPGNVAGDSKRDFVIGAPGSGDIEQGAVVVVDGSVRALSPLLDDLSMDATLHAGAPRAVSAQSGGTIRYRLRAPARLTFTVFALRAGRQVAGATARPRPGRRGRLVTRTCRAGNGLTGRRCLRAVRVGSFVRTHGRAGRFALRFTPRVKGRALPTGRYLLGVVATGPGRRIFGPVRVAFRVASG